MSFFVKFFLCCNNTKDSEGENGNNNSKTFSPGSFANLETTDKKYMTNHDAREDNILNISGTKKSSDNTLKPEAVSFRLEVSPSNNHDISKSPEFSSVTNKKQQSKQVKEEDDREELKLESRSESQSLSRFEPATKSRFATNDAIMKRAQTLKVEGDEDNNTTVAGFIKMNRVVRASEEDESGDIIPKSTKSESSQQNGESNNESSAFQRSQSKKKTQRELMNSTPILTSAAKKH